MAQVGNSIDQMFKELTIQFPEIPEDKVKTVMWQNSNNKSKCVDVLSRESKRYYDLYSGSETPTPQFHGLRIDVPNRQRSQSGCSSGSDEFRGRSDSTGSRNSLPGCTNTPVGSQYSSGMHHSATVPAFTSTHTARVIVTPGPTTAPPSSNNFDHFMPPHSTGRSFPPSIACSVSGDSRPAAQYQGYPQQSGAYVPIAGAPGQQYPPQQGSSAGSSGPVPSSGAGGASGYGAQWYNNATSVMYPPQTVIHPNNRPAGYPYQGNSNQNWNYIQGSVPKPNPDSHVPNRPERFNEGFPQSGRKASSDSSPHYNMPGNASLPYMSPDRLGQQHKQSPTTPTRPAVTPPDGAYGMPSSSYQGSYGGGNNPGYNYMTGSTPPNTNPPATHVSTVYIPMNMQAGHTTPPVNPPSNIYNPGQSMNYHHQQPGLSLQINAGAYDQRPPTYPQLQPRKLAWKDEGGQRPDWTDKDPVHERFMQPPMQPTITPSPTSSGGASLPNLDLFGGPPREADRRHSAGSDDTAYSSALCLHQKARMDKLSRDLEEGRRTRDALRMEVELMEKRSLERRKARNHILSADDVQKVRDENRRLQIDIQLLAHEIDMVNNGQTPLGWTDQRTSNSQNFYGNIPSGQQGPLGSRRLEAAGGGPGVGRGNPPPRPPPPAQPPSYARSQAESQQPTFSMLSLPPSHPPPPPVLCPARSPQTPPRPAARPEPEEEENWNCSACTFANHPLLDKCECCEMPRVKKAFS